MRLLAAARRAQRGRRAEGGLDEAGSLKQRVNILLNCSEADSAGDVGPSQQLPSTAGRYAFAAVLEDGGKVVAWGDPKQGGEIGALATVGVNGLHMSVRSRL